MTIHGSKIVLVIDNTPLSPEIIKLEETEIYENIIYLASYTPMLNPIESI